jgi:adenosine deaminase
MKADLHRHLGGSIPYEAVAKFKNMPLDDVKKLMTYSDGDEFTYESFFEKFKVLDDVEWTLDNIDHTIRNVIWNLKKEQIDYAEIKFSVNKYLPYINMDVEKAILWLACKFAEHSETWGIEVDLILSLKHDMDKDIQKKIADSIFNDNIAEAVSGIDIVGNENFFDEVFYEPIFQNWHDAKRVCMAHVGEINKPENVYLALDRLRLDRVCHGIAVADDAELAKKTRDRLISFDLCLSSNIHTGVANAVDHPVKKMLDNGFLITIGTDDPVIFDTTLDNEFELLKNIAGLTDDEISMIGESAMNFSAKEIIGRKQR